MHTEDELHALLKIPGALKIITNEVRTDLGVRVDLKRASSYVCHNVVDVAGPDRVGRYVARSAEGDWTMGHPDALLARLRQWRCG